MEPHPPAISPAEHAAVCWRIQVSCVLFTVTNVGLTEVLPVWLSTPADVTGHPGSGGLGLSPSLIGNLQSTTGVGNIVLALFVTYRIINAFGPVNTFAASLFVNAFAAFGPPTVQALPEGCPEAVALFVMCVAYSLVAASRNMMFATALMLSKEAATGGPGVAIGINQSACSLGSALGPMLTGFVYTQSLQQLRTCVPFFISVGTCSGPAPARGPGIRSHHTLLTRPRSTPRGLPAGVLGCLPGLVMRAKAPPWPWKMQKPPQSGHISR